MSSDAIIFDAYDRLVGRKSMASSPVSIVVRNANEERLSEIVDRCLTLLTGRRTSDEILLLVEKEPELRPPSMVGATSIRTVVLPSVATRAGLAWALTGSRWPLLVFVGADAALPRTTFLKMLESLEHADVVVGKRRSLRGKRNPISWLVRRMFGVAITDPLSPYFGFRRDVVADVPLEVAEPLTEFELFAKSTFAFAIYDEIEVEDSGPPSPPLHRILASHWRELLHLFSRPTFWTYSLDSRAVRPTPQETAPPGVSELVVRPVWTSPKVHPLTRSYSTKVRRSPPKSAGPRP